jgi:hypothetical protein
MESLLLSELGVAEIGSDPILIFFPFSGVLPFLVVSRFPAVVLRLNMSILVQCHLQCPPFFCCEKCFSSVGKLCLTPIYRDSAASGVLSMPSNCRCNLVCSVSSSLPLSLSCRDPPSGNCTHIYIAPVFSFSHQRSQFFWGFHLQ